MRAFDLSATIARLKPRACGRHGSRCSTPRSNVGGTMSRGLVRFEIFSRTPDGAMSDVGQTLDAAFAAYGESRWDDAERLCQEILTCDRDNLEALHMLGVIAGASGRTSAGIELLRRAAKLDPKSIDVFADLGHLLKEDGH